MKIELSLSLSITKYIMQCSSTIIIIILVIIILLVGVHSLLLLYLDDNTEGLYQADHRAQHSIHIQ